MSVWSKRITESGAFWGMVTGFGVNVGMNALSLAGFVEWPVIADPILVGVVSSYIAVRIVSNPEDHSIVASTYRDALHQMPAQERDPLAIQQTLTHKQACPAGPAAWTMREEPCKAPRI